jgi:hypothetical protein
MAMQQIAGRRESFELQLAISGQCAHRQKPPLPLLAGAVLYLEWVVVGRLILLMGGGEEVFACFGAAQVEVQGNPLLSIAGGGGCKSLSNDTVTALVASDGDTDCS